MGEFVALATTRGNVAVDGVVVDGGDIVAAGGDNDH